MTDAALITKTATFVRQKFTGEATGHDWWHIYRVWQLAKRIAAHEQAVDMTTVELGALLHDIADWKFHDGDIEAGPRAARVWLKQCQADEAVIVQIEDIIRNVSFKGAGVPSSMKTIEGKIIHDADKLDALGAIGIARTFAYGGANARPMHDPDAPAPQLHASFEAYKTAKGSSTHHFYEKLLLLKDRMYTDTARQIAETRQAYMETFLQEFYDEWDGQR